MTNYASVSTRVKATFIDTIVLFVVIYSISFIIGQLSLVPTYVRIISIIVSFFLYEPLLVSISGATVGHFFSDIVVKSESNHHKNIPFLKAFIRFTLKLALGWISLLTIHSNKQKQSIHDAAAKSVVIPYKTTI